MAGMAKRTAVCLTALSLLLCGTVYAADSCLILKNDHPSVLADGVRVSLNGQTPVLEDETMLIPVRAFAELYQGTVQWYAERETANLRFEKKVIQVKQGEGFALVNGKRRELKTAPKLIDNTLYMDVNDFGELMHHPASAFANGIYTLGKKLTQAEMDGMMNTLFYDRPAPEQILQDIAKKSPNKAHPRIMMTKARIVELRELVQTDETMKRAYKNVVSAADVGLKQKVSVYEKPDGIRLLETSRTVLTLIQKLSMAYQLTQDEKYAERAWQELEAVCSFPDWNPEHFLDVGEMSAAVAIGYDWFYDWFTEEQRKTIRNALEKFSFDPALDAYRGIMPNYGFAEAKSNWNIVGNGGVGMAALAVADEADVSAKAAECIASGLVGLEKMLIEFAPDGAWYEGISYWKYTVEYLAMYISALYTATGTDYGCFSGLGVKETAYFPIYMWGPVAGFSFGDSESTKFDVPEWSFFADKLSQPAILSMRKAQIENGGGSYKDLLWYNEKLEAQDAVLNLDKHFGGKVEISTMRSSFEDKDAVFAAVRGGDAVVNHGHLDLGTFDIQANGVAWTVDAGADNYNFPGYFDTAKQRWDYYRMRAESHNCMVLNPSEEPEMQLQSRAPIALHSKEKGAYSVIDLTDAYAKYADSAIRAVGLTDNRRRVLVQDEVDLKEPSEYYWFMHTYADIAIAEDGKSAILSKDGKRLYAQIAAENEDAKFTVLEDKPLPGSKQIEGQKLLPSLHKLTIHLPSTERVRLAVAFTPLQANEEIAVKTEPLLPITDWKIEDGTIPSVTELYLDDEPLKGFAPGTYHYTMELERADAPIPKLRVDSAFKTRVIQAESMADSSIVEVFDEESEEPVIKYYVSYHYQEPIGLLNGKVKYKPVGVTASDVPEAVNVPENTIDNRLDTRWSAQGYQWIMYDLGETKTVDAVALAWMSGNARKYRFAVETSEDGMKWEEVWSGTSGGRTSDFEVYSFNERSARYVRIVGQGSDVGSWNSLTEFGIYKTKNKGAE